MELKNHVRCPLRAMTLLHRFRLQDTTVSAGSPRPYGKYSIADVSARHWARTTRPRGLFSRWGQMLIGPTRKK